MRIFTRIEPPRPLNAREYRLALDAAYARTTSLRETGIEGFVLLVLDIDQRGMVTKAQATVPPAWTRGLQIEAILIDGRTGERLPGPPPHTLHPALCQAAEEAILVERFQPAMRRGGAVPFRGYRLGIAFHAEIPQQS